MKREFLKDKINELESDSKNKNIRDLYKSMNEFKKGYEPITYLVKGEKDDLLADPQNSEYVDELLLSTIECPVCGGVLGRQKYRQQSHLCQSLAPLRLRLRLRLLLES
jgi:C4-type Zn-finger protein